MKKRTENDVVKACLQWLEAHGWFCWRQNTLPVYDSTLKRFRKFSGLKGVSDIIALKDHPTHTCGGLAWFIECKLDKGRQSPEQAEFQRNVEACGHKYTLARSVDDLEQS